MRKQIYNVGETRFQLNSRGLFSLWAKPWDNTIRIYPNCYDTLKHVLTIPPQIMKALLLEEMTPEELISWLKDTKQI